MAEAIYLASAEGNTGKSTIAVGLVEALNRRVGRVGVFRPVSRTADGGDYVLEMLLRHTTADIGESAASGVTYEQVHHDPDAALAEILADYRAMAAACDAVVIIGSDYTDVGTPTELRFNARVAANLGAAVVLALGGRRGDSPDARTASEVAQVAEIALAEFRGEHAALLGVVVNRCDPGEVTEIAGALAALLPPDTGVFAIPEDPGLVAPSLATVLARAEGVLAVGDPALLERDVAHTVVAAMTLENLLPRLAAGTLVVMPGDRTDTLLGVLLAHAGDTFPALAGVLLTGGLTPAHHTQRLIDGLGVRLPIARTELGTFETAGRVAAVHGRLAAESPQKYARAVALFDAHVDAAVLLGAMDVHHSSVVTPLMFEYDLLSRAAAAPRHIVLPEGDDDRVLEAAGIVLRRGVARLTILGDPQQVRARAAGLGVDLAAADVIDPFAEPLRQRFAEAYATERAHRGVSLELARDTVTDVSYFGTLMVHLGLADGMVSGATHTTAHTIRPAFELVKTAPGVKVVSSVFLMALADRVLVYGDCAIIPVPTAEQLADIAISAADTASRFGIEPRVAMLSYSTGTSGTGADVDKVREATALVHERAPLLLAEGPIQYDAAADPAVAAAKMPDSPVAGRATVFVFPDLNTGNNTYKAVQRSSNALAIGPVLQGLNRPINDLSRGALVRDIVNTIAITAIQAQSRAAAPSPSQDQEGLPS